MVDSPHSEILELIDRIVRISSAEHWVGDLNPAQLATLSYLSKANRYSRAPSQVAKYLSARRGTVSGTLKALLRKGLIEEHKSESDRRRTSYDLTREGVKALNFSTAITAALDGQGQKDKADLKRTLKAFVRDILQARGDRSFGICATCRHHHTELEGPRCALLNVSLRISETGQICYEHEIAA